MTTAQIPASVEEVIKRMRAIKTELDPRDGVASFNNMYLRVTELVGQQITEGFFKDPDFVERLDVIFAQLYFDAVDADKRGKPPNAVWEPVFDSRANRTVWPLQFALAGMNAHINHDLAVAVVKTCKERSTTPDTKPVYADYLKVNDLLAKVEAEIRAEYEPWLLKLATRDAEALKHILCSFGIARARDAAWATTQMLWIQRNNSLLLKMTMRSLEESVSTSGRMLVTPVVPPPK
ncbi:hypothetical protein SAMN04244553_2043 [Nocardia amikacinitolerans]|uniref:Uncharacterized protein n=1 Tax=Nocardia amikacinitolerans TaxID=756689 RepID=A0A285L6H0_9NOCA|nr:DUF5995 family protein [Nocardia amikacinitolerans]MCP2274689.1 hypothetical protein [Nocardia amikacinitolerans]MCP2320506.1 hypothetical protein [Nocardia amikacinitolerans]SNY80474.1 hypothetical protein SAMN04244553_2043 [Nocardia amikacinitolerans]